MTTRAFLISAVWAPAVFAMFSLFFQLALLFTGIGYLAFGAFVTWRLLRLASAREMGRFFSWTPLILLPFQLAWLLSLGWIRSIEILEVHVPIEVALVEMAMFLLFFGYMYVGAVGFLHWFLSRMDLIVDKLPANPALNADARQEPPRAG
jgi:hypothetical protein